MININEFIKRAIKKEIFNSNDIENKAARQVFSEIKTKYIDIREEITSEVQYKIVKKMFNDRNKSIEIYKEANRIDLLLKEEFELNVCKFLLEELEKDLPKQMNEFEIENKIIEILKSNPNAKIGEVMKGFSGLNADKSIVANIAKKIISKN